ncbi:MAG: ATP-binding protein [Kordiimonadaceae bacterium]|nr:ATP-binding protein [Kordiimonadaceae bacterium]MBO6567995.1 ATP-binding protein [Kordiimonadaceae bacterium]MBO6964275.1 ATP-binding protein [Kordiimonadaceae bacterium]
MTGIRSLEIQKLYGTFDYQLPESSDGFANKAIFYGDNGCGKTTILSLIFHLLAPARRGHRSKVALIPFESAKLVMQDGVTIEAKKLEGLTGSYVLQCTSNSGEERQFEFVMHSDEGGKIEGTDKGLSEFLQDLNLSLFFLTADRKILNGEEDVGNEETEYRKIYRDYRFGERGLLATSSLDRVLSEANHWISSKSVEGTNVGSGTVNEIYENIVRSITRTLDSGVSGEDVNIDDLVTKLDELSSRNSEFSKYGITPQLRVEEIKRDVLAASTASAKHAIFQVVEPYLSGIEARLDALEDVRRITDAFVRNFESFFIDKEVTFKLSGGLRIKNHQGINLTPNMLSSGEQQLLRLFCHTLVSRDQPSIFMIDEPELSLNIKWQRKLIHALDELVTGSDMQFLFASHSMEILAQHRDSIIHLKQN